MEDDFCLTFEVSYGDGSNMKTYPLKQNAGDIPVTKDNRQGNSLYTRTYDNYPRSFKHDLETCYL